MEITWIFDDAHEILTYQSLILVNSACIIILFIYLSKDNYFHAYHNISKGSSLEKHLQRTLICYSILNHKFLRGLVL